MRRQTVSLFISLFYPSSCIRAHRVLLLLLPASLRQRERENLVPEHDCTCELPPAGALSRSTLFSNSQLHSRPRILPLALFPGLSYRLLSAWVVFLPPVLFLRHSLFSFFFIRVRNEINGNTFPFFSLWLFFFSIRKY